jgi:3-deoxy-D-manno-octulosonic-acid transferase
MGKIDLVAARETADAERFRSIGVPIEQVSVGGNLKYDILPWDLQPGRDHPMPGSGLQKDPSLYWTAGSVRAGEEAPVLNAYAEILKSHPALKLIFAPRHLDRMSTVTGILKSLNLSSTLRSEALKGKGTVGTQVLIWDTFGDLWQAYQQAALVFVGGSLVDKGGQNPIEPAWFGKPVIFGPSMSNFAEPAQALLASRGAIEVKDSKQLAETVRHLLANTDERNATGARAKKAVEGFFGLATRQTSDALRRYDIL